MENHGEICVGSHLHIGFDGDRRAGSVVNVAYDELILILDGVRQGKTLNMAARANDVDGKIGGWKPGSPAKICAG